jgi:hypothetical protein
VGRGCTRPADQQGSSDSSRWQHEETIREDPPPTVVTRNYVAGCSAFPFSRPPPDKSKPRLPYAQQCIVASLLCGPVFGLMLALMTSEQTATIDRKARLIMSQCKANASLYGFSSPQLSVPRVTINFDKDPCVETLESLHHYHPANEQVELLRALYQAQDDDGKKVVATVCWEGCLYPSCSFQTFAFLLRYRSFRRTIELLTEKPYDNFLKLAKLTLPALAHILRFDHTYIETTDLEALCDLLTTPLSALRPKGVMTTGPGGRQIRHYSLSESTLLDKLKPIDALANYVCVQATRIQYLRLRKELREEANFEVNQDRERLVGNLSSLRFSDKLTEFLKFAEVEFAKAQHAFSYKTSVDQVRSFFAELLNETAEKIAERRGETLATAKVDTKYPVEVRKYLRETGFFSDQFKTLVEGLYKFMSDEGTHTLGATKDVARIARNLAIEIGLLITKRLQQPSAGA